MTQLRAVTILSFSIMFIAIAAAMLGGGFLTEGRQMLASNWGRLTLIDLYVGLALFSAFVWWRERSHATALVWIAGFAVLGNLATAGYLLWTLRNVSSLDELMKRQRA